ncbi:MAG: hypothetical protein R6W72_00875 [Desulfurivibrionaceae bacterium]
MQGDLKRDDLNYAVVANASSIMALSLIRSLGRSKVRVVAVFCRKRAARLGFHTVRHSKFIWEKHDFEENNYETNLLSSLVEIGLSFTKKAVLFPVTDHDMLIVSANRTTLGQYFHIFMPTHKMVETILHKELFYEFASLHGLPIPKTFMPTEVHDIERISADIKYPCIIKPTWRTAEWIKAYGNQKVLIAESADRLKDLFYKTFKIFNKLTIQEIVDGTEKNILCSFAYFDAHSKPLAMFMCRKIRQYPPFFGDTAIAESIYNEKIASLTMEICRKLELVGYASIEFKKDTRSDSYKIMEITIGRINRQAGLADSLGDKYPADLVQLPAGSGGPWKKRIPA